MQPYDDFAGLAGRFGAVTQPASMIIASANAARRVLCAAAGHGNIVELFLLKEKIKLDVAALRARVSQDGVNEL